MSHDEIRLRLERIYQAIRGSQRRLWPHDRLVEDLHIDSLTGLELLVRVEDEFGIRLVDDDRAGTLTTVGELIALIAELSTEDAATGAAGTRHGDPTGDRDGDTASRPEGVPGEAGR